MVMAMSFLPCVVTMWAKSLQQLARYFAWVLAHVEERFLNNLKLSVDEVLLVKGDGLILCGRC